MKCLQLAKAGEKSVFHRGWRYSFVCMYRKAELRVVVAVFISSDSTCSGPKRAVRSLLYFLAGWLGGQMFK